MRMSLPSFSTPWFCVYTTFNHRQWSFLWPGEDGGWLEACRITVVPDLVWWLTVSGQISEAVCTYIICYFNFCVSCRHLRSFWRCWVMIFFSGWYLSIIVHVLRLLRWSSGENVEAAATAQQVSAQSDNCATTDRLEQLKGQLQEKDKTLEELHGQVCDLEVSM